MVIYIADDGLESIGIPMDSWLEKTYSLKIEANSLVTIDVQKNAWTYDEEKNNCDRDIDWGKLFDCNKVGLYLL